MSGLLNYCEGTCCRMRECEAPMKSKLPALPVTRFNATTTRFYRHSTCSKGSWLAATPAALGSPSPGSKFFNAAISWSWAYLELPTPKRKEAFWFFERFGCFIVFAVSCVFLRAFARFLRAFSGFCGRFSEFPDLRAFASKTRQTPKLPEISSRWKLQVLLLQFLANLYEQKRHPKIHSETCKRHCNFLELLSVNASWTCIIFDSKSSKYSSAP